MSRPSSVAPAILINVSIRRGPSDEQVRQDVEAELWQSNKRHLLFKRFSQVDASTRREFGGSGLGLAISEQLVRLMGGEIIVESKEGRGTSFTARIVLPLAGPDDVRLTKERNRELSTTPARILLAEDLEVNQEIATFILEKAGHSVDVAADGSQAVSRFLSGSYDLVLMDIQMPVMDGIDATRAIRALEHPARDIPIIAMTTNVLSQQVEAFRQAGMDDHIGKPIRNAAPPPFIVRLCARTSRAGGVSAAKADSRTGKRWPHCRADPGRCA